MKPTRLTHYTLFIIHFSLAVLCTAQHPSITGTYYYDKDASTADNHIYISTTGTYYHVDSTGATTIGAPATLPVSTPYRAVVTTSAASLQFYNAHPDLYTITTATTASNPTGAPLITYAARSGTWTARDLTLTLSTGTESVIWLVGATGAEAHPATFIGQNLTILANAPNAGAITMADGNNTITLADSAITSITTRNNTSQAILLADTRNLGGNHFTGTNLTITNNSGRVFAFGAGDNTITLHNTTILNTGAGAAFGWNATTSTTRRSFTAGSTVTLNNTHVTTTADYSPIFQMVGDSGAATVTGGTLATTGAHSPILRLVAQNDAIDRTTFTAIFQNTTLAAPQSSLIDINIAASSTNYGANQTGGAAKNLTTTIEDYVTIIIQSSTATGQAALRIAAAGSHASPYAERTNLFVYDSTFSGGIQMIAGGGVNETSGAYLTFTASNSLLSGGLSITGANPARLSNQAILHVCNSTWTGDITLTSRGNLVLHFTDTPVDGNLSLSGSTWAELRLANSPITGAITTADTATLIGEVLGAGSLGPINARGGTIDLTLDQAPRSTASTTASTTATITAAGDATVTLRIGGEVSIPGGIHLENTATLAITLRDTARFTADIAIHDRATLSLATARNAPLTLAGNIALAGIWRIPGKTILNGTLALTTPDGTIAIENARHDSLTLANGLTGNGCLQILSIDGGALGASEIRVIHDPTGAFTAAPNTTTPLVLARAIDCGLAAYTLENRPDGAWLVGGLSSAGAAIFNSQALAIEDWFAAFAPLNYRLALLRQVNASIFSGDMDDIPRARGDTGSLWFQARSETTRVNPSGASLDFTSRTLGLTAGIDTRRDFNAATLTLGLFADTARTARDFIGDAAGRTTAAGAGLYANYHHHAGFHATAIARFDAYENSLDTHNPNNAMSAACQTQAAGIALEAGWRLALPKGWWLEPAAQVSFASFPGVSYTTKTNRHDNTTPVTISDARATQCLGRLALGKTLDKNWLLRGHLAHAAINASGGTFTAPGLDHARFTIAGNRTEASLGVVRHLGRTGRLTLDASFTAASDYTRPCSLSFGWSMDW